MTTFRFIHIASILCIAVLCTTNCSDNNPVFSSHKVLAPRVAHLPLNTANPYDSAGIKHNILVEHYAQYFASGDTTVPLAKSAIYEGIDNLTNPDGSSLSTLEKNWLKSSLDTIVATHGDYDWTLDEIEAFESDKTSDREEAYIHQVADAVRSATDSASLMQNLLAIETAMMQEVWDSDEVIARMGISVIKHSAYMWMTKTVAPSGCPEKDIKACAEDYRVWVIVYDTTCDEEKAGRLSAGWSQLIWEITLCPSLWNITW